MRQKQSAAPKLGKDVVLLRMSFAVVCGIGLGHEYCLCGGTVYAALRHGSQGFSSNDRSCILKTLVMYTLTLPPPQTLFLPIILLRYSLRERLFVHAARHPSSFKETSASRKQKGIFIFPSRHEKRGNQQQRVRSSVKVLRAVIVM